MEMLKKMELISPEKGRVMNGRIYQTGFCKVLSRTVFNYIKGT